MQRWRRPVAETRDPPDGSCGGGSDGGNGGGGSGSRGSDGGRSGGSKNRGDDGGVEGGGCGCGGGDGGGAAPWATAACSPPWGSGVYSTGTHSMKHTSGGGGGLAVGQDSGRRRFSSAHARGRQLRGLGAVGAAAARVVRGAPAAAVGAVGGVLGGGMPLPATEFPTLAEALAPIWLARGGVRGRQRRRGR